MKVLIFSHKSDIDGMGGVILAKLAFKEVDYLLCETFNLSKEISKYLENGEIYNYDLVFVTDMWLEKNIATTIYNNSKLKNKFYVFDHHESAKEEKLDCYDFINITIKNSNGLCSGTSLFYEYLTNHGYLKESDALNKFVLLTRIYDTWEWKKENMESANDLAVLFNILGIEGYINLIYQKLLNDNNEFIFSELETNLIINKKKQIEETVKSYAKKIYYREILELKAGIVFIDYEYRNDMAEYLRLNNYPIDFVMLVAFQYGVISYRNVNPEVKVRKIAEYFGGKGHDYAASSPIKIEKIEKLVDVLIGRI